MANLEIEGRLSGKSLVQTGQSARGPWAKQEFQVEIQEGKFPSTAVFSVWGEDKVKDLDKYSVGDQVKVSFNISSREYNGRWYTDLRAWRIEPAGASALAAPTHPQHSQPTPPPPTIDDLPADSSDSTDDLPF